MCGVVIPRKGHIWIYSVGSDFRLVPRGTSLGCISVYRLVNDGQRSGNGQRSRVMDGWATIGNELRTERTGNDSTGNDPVTHATVRSVSGQREPGDERRGNVTVNGKA